MTSELPEQLDIWDGRYWKVHPLQIKQLPDKQLVCLAARPENEDFMIFGRKETGELNTPVGRVHGTATWIIICFNDFDRAEEKFVELSVCLPADWRFE